MGRADRGHVEPRAGDRVEHQVEMAAAGECRRRRVAASGEVDQFEPGTRLDSWMFRIVRTVFIDETRRRKRRSTADDTELDFVGFDARIHEGMQARFDLAVVRAELGRMSEEHRAVLALVTLDGMSYQEAADTLGVPIGTVMSRLARARKRLAQVLESGDGRASDASGAA